jgi:hypothetical protein
MNLVLFASGGLCWRNTQFNRSAGEIVELIRRFWFAGLVFVYRRGDASLVELLDAQRAFNDTTQHYNEARAEYERSPYLIDATVGNGL